ncbi:hypothetical protein J132_09771 [Termitomyces sp. J132]|nr:hypothetical protein H2248_010959 [Termitomyces sp. 'cryptogamus']KNZ78844.1 hypothetical protein J132_09771 [Termitomyces sp. J132]
MQPAIAPCYSFLSKPPQKTRPLCAPPPPPTFARKRSSTFSAIAAWAAHVQPGSPSSPSTRPSPSFLVLETPSPAHKDFALALTDLGYTSVFVNLSTPSPVAPATRPSPLKRFRSFSILRSPTVPSPDPRKKAGPKPKPPSLASELALMQFAGGGSTEHNIKRVMAARARAAAPAGTKPAAVGDVYRDGKGGVWWDREEEMEYVHLLSGHQIAAHDDKWVEFGGEEEETGLALASLATDGRRGSGQSLDVGCVVRPVEEDTKIVTVPVTHPTQEPILTIPSRPRRGQHHLRPSPNFFLLDLNAFSVPRTPRSPSAFPVSPPVPSHAQPHADTHTQSQRKRGAARRRPAPLDIVAHVPVRGVSPDHGNDNEDEDVKRDFLDASFTPVPRPEAGAGAATAACSKNENENENEKQKAGAQIVNAETYRAPTHPNGNRQSEGGAKSLKKKKSRQLLSFFGMK